MAIHYILRRYPHLTQANPLTDSFSDPLSENNSPQFPSASLLSCSLEAIWISLQAKCSDRRPTCRAESEKYPLLSVCQ